MKTLFLLANIFGLVWSQGNTIQGPITQHFQNWLNANGYQNDDFVRSDLGNYGSYGGKKSDSDQITKEPVIFFHGNSDCALDYKDNNPLTMSIATGWGNTIAYFEQKGYSSQELYATSWGDVNEMNAESRTHDCPTLTRLRRFIEAVLAYTKASKIDIISHSMGVTLARKLIQGGVPKGGSCDLGKPLNDKVDTFLGISGANYGLCNCQEGFEATCNQQNGFWPGGSCGTQFLCELEASAPCYATQYSAYLQDVNENPLKIADYVYCAWSHDDDLIMYHDLIWGSPTSYIPGALMNKTYVLLTHMQTKELTAADQYAFVTNHSENSDTCSSGCPSNEWYQSTEKPCNCYNFVQIPVNWKSANEVCDKLNPGSTLASIETALQNTELLHNGKNQTTCEQFFIGYERGSNDKWSWINKDKSSYHNWRSGFPTSNKNDSYAQLNVKDGKWTNVDLHASGCFICEIKNA